MIDILKAVCLKNKKCQKLHTTLEIRSCPSHEKLISFIDSNSESFDAMRILFNDLRCIAEFSNSEQEIIEFSTVLSYSYKNGKNEYIESFFVGIIAISIGTLVKISEISPDMIQFNLDHWNTLSDLVLLSQRASINDLSKKKKKKTDKTNTQSGRLGLRLAEATYKIENFFIIPNYLGSKKLKVRGVKLAD